jgi:3-oxoacyl-[acyl-carrier-protein] synthase II
MNTQWPASPIAITGMAWITALGDEIEPVWILLLSGHSALESGRPPIVSRPTLPDVPELRIRALAEAAARRALSDAGLSPGDERVRLVAGTDAALGATTGHLADWLTEVGQTLHLAREPIALSTACASGSDALLLGAELVRAGWTDICLCGGADAPTPDRTIGHGLLGTSSPRATLRAFDRSHDGTVFGEGAAFLVLESVVSVARRGARPYGFIRGAGSANDAATLTAPGANGLGAQLAMRRALADAGVEAGDVGVVKAHGSGTPTNDRAEAAALHAIFVGPNLPLVFAVKGAVAHTMGASGAVEAIALLQALRTSQAPPIAGLHDPETTWVLPLARERSRVEGTIGLGLAMGFGGCASSLVLEAGP